MQLRTVNIAAFARLRDDLTAAHLLPLAHQDFVIVRISGDPTVRVLHQNQVAIPFQFITGIDDLSLSATRTEVPAGTARLMPSFRPPSRLRP